MQILILHTFFPFLAHYVRLTYNLPKVFFLIGILGCHTEEDEINTCLVLDKLIEHIKDLEIIHPDIRFINARQKKLGLIRLKRIPINKDQLRSSLKRPFQEEEEDFGSKNDDDEGTSNKKRKLFHEENIKIETCKRCQCIDCIRRNEQIENIPKILGQMDQMKQELERYKED